MCATGTILITRGSFLTDFVISIVATSPLSCPLRKWGWTMDAKYLRQQSELCSRLADGLSLNNPSRFELMRMAEDFRNRAKEVETKNAGQQSQSNEPENRAKQSH
jgi:hypothetical protein